MGNVIFTEAMNEVVMIFDLESIGRMYLISLLFLSFSFLPRIFVLEMTFSIKKKKIEGFFLFLLFFLWICTKFLVGLEAFRGKQIDKNSKY